MLYLGGLCCLTITDCNVILFTGRFLSDDLFVTHKTLRAQMKATLKKRGGHYTSKREVTVQVAIHYPSKGEEPIITYSLGVTLGKLFKPS